MRVFSRQHCQGVLFGDPISSVQCRGPSSQVTSGSSLKVFLLGFDLRWDPCCYGPTDAGTVDVRWVPK